MCTHRRERHAAPPARAARAKAEHPGRSCSVRAAASKARTSTSECRIRRAVLSRRATHDNKLSRPSTAEVLRPPSHSWSICRAAAAASGPHSQGNKIDMVGVCPAVGVGASQGNKRDMRQAPPSRRCHARRAPALSHGCSASKCIRCPEAPLPPLARDQRSALTRPGSSRLLRERPSSTNGERRAMEVAAIGTRRRTWPASGVGCSRGTQTQRAAPASQAAHPQCMSAGWPEPS